MTNAMAQIQLENKPQTVGIPTSFPQFPDFPFEIRIQIWKEASINPCFIQVLCDYKGAQVQ